MRDLEIISEPGYKSACITISRMGWRAKEPGTLVPPEQSTWLERSALPTCLDGSVVALAARWRTAAVTGKMAQIEIDKKSLS